MQVFVLLLCVIALAFGQVQLTTPPQRGYNASTATQSTCGGFNTNSPFSPDLYTSTGVINVTITGSGSLTFNYGSTTSRFVAPPSFIVIPGGPYTVTTGTYQYKSNLNLLATVPVADFAVLQAVFVSGTNTYYNCADIFAEYDGPAKTGPASTLAVSLVAGAAAAALV